MIYDSIYALIEQYIYGAVTVGSYQELCCIALASIACVFLMAIPFIVCYKFIRMVVG